MEVLKLLESNPDLKTKIPSRRGKRDCPRLENDHPHFSNTIAEIHGSAAEEKKRTDLMRSVKTLHDLTEGLNS